MLHGIPDILSPQLLKVLMEMGHGDELVLGDGNFPAASTASRLIRSDGHRIPDLLEAILSLFPLDQYVDSPVFLMQVVPGDDTKPTIWNTYREIIRRSPRGQGEGEIQLAYLERFEFYERARRAYAVVASGEQALYANLILKKGVIQGPDC